ncbi:M1 family metallopeptidase [Pseudemcibacter aquimaris]|uniref:M1 family metallopeptidase n=1 Tax=Pseudemcibacter aquimaris TaxID=2857064 RepID=UPI002012DC9B|nr:M1 family metallopeptidase [Pseudemcibacter aquimaris]MCC3859899.1 M1 family metallopeptidase [Pseudemcibacter aquimaris]WDU57231.1 M1 family metallopeptidase [Pseudemcibacter aquimaris]
MPIKSFILFLSTALLINISNAQTPEQLNDKFRQLDEYLPTANAYRTASGAPGHEYWQQQADYKIDVTLDENAKTITGTADVTYHNNSPDELKYIWMQLDQDKFNSKTSMELGAETVSKSTKGMSFKRFSQYKDAREFDGGFKITSLKDEIGNDLKMTIVGTMMRVDLPAVMAPGDTFSFSIDWWYNILDYDVGRQGMEYFERDDNYLFQIAQWYPRLTVYSDYEGWHNKEFQGKGEFTLEFGNYDVSITVPSDHVVASTGTLQNAADVLTMTQRDRLIEARTASAPMFIITPNEALENEKEKATDTKTWHFTAENVRDFAFASSRKFIWDAMGHRMKENGETVMAMSFYPMAGIPTWPKVSTHAVAHTLNVYNKYSLTYPYPTAISVNGPVSGMEYPMISFNPTRPTVHPDGSRTYGRLSKLALIMVIIHEVGHNYFPMIVNSDERQWTWMDEGLNSFLQNVAQQEWSETYPLQRIDPRNIVNYMTSTNQRPIMTNAEQTIQNGNNAYAKPSTALNILRESIMGPELFDFAFREFAQRWKFKRPTPADFFRTMEDASGIDLDWFWRGWFYTTDHVDISLDNVRHFTIDTKNPEIEEAFKRRQEQAKRKHPSYFSNDHLPKRVDEFPDILDFYNENDEFTVTNKMRDEYNKLIAGLEDWQIQLLNDDSNIYMLDFTNKGGLVMPIYLEIEYVDGSREEMRFPAEIWKLNYDQVTKMIVTEKAIKSVELDPKYETADADRNNNHFPSRMEQSRFELVKSRGLNRRDMMNENLTEITPLQQLINERREKDETDADAAARRLIEWADLYTEKGPH